MNDVQNIKLAVIEANSDERCVISSLWRLRFGVFRS